MNAKGIHTWFIPAALAVVLWASPGKADTLTFYPTDDSFVAQRAPDYNYGSSVIMRVRNIDGGSLIWEEDALLKFDLAPIPSGTDVTSATLHMYYYWRKDSNPAGRELTCHRVINDWEEESITWNTRPDFALKPTSSSIVPSSVGTWMEWDVTSDVQAFLDQPDINYGWQIMDLEPWGGANIPFMGFSSKEHGEFAPYLTVIPEPGTLSLLLLGGLGLIRRRL